MELYELMNESALGPVLSVALEVMKYLIMVVTVSFILLRTMSKFKKADAYLVTGLGWMSFVAWFPALAFHPVTLGTVIFSLSVLHGLASLKGLDDNDKTRQGFRLKPWYIVATILSAGIALS